MVYMLIIKEIDMKEILVMVKEQDMVSLYLHHQNIYMKGKFLYYIFIILY